MPSCDLSPPPAPSGPSRTSRCAVYFVASPLQLLAARQIAATHEAGSRQVLVWYKRGLAKLVRPGDWDACHFLAWPRWDPLPGPFGGLRRLRRNLREVAAVVGPCDTVVLHSAVFDTEAINYFLHDLPRRCGARHRLARILPDGLISTRRYPLSLAKRGVQWLRKLRRLVAPELNYTPFAGDRIGSDAPFCDRIYVLPGLPHAYPAARVLTLAPLASAAGASPRPRSGRALVIDQPLVGSGLLDPSAVQRVSQTLADWLAARGLHEVWYKPHPKDRRQDLRRPGYREVETDQPLEAWLPDQDFEAIVGVRSSALLFARQIHDPARTEVRAFGWSDLRFKSEAERADLSAVFRRLGIPLDTDSSACVSDPAHARSAQPRLHHHPAVESRR